VLLAANGSPLVAGAGSFVVGLGMGLLSLSSLVLIQESVDIAQRGSATASNIFSRNLGSALGATFFGAVFNFGLARQNGGVSVPEAQLRQLLQGLPVADANEASLRMALGGSLHLTFMSMLVVSLVIVALVLMLPRDGLQPSSGRVRS
jgi:hypothetical protein